MQCKSCGQNEMFFKVPGESISMCGMCGSRIYHYSPKQHDDDKTNSSGFTDDNMRANTFTPIKDTRNSDNFTTPSRAWSELVSTPDTVASDVTLTPTRHQCFDDVITPAKYQISNPTSADVELNGDTTPSGILSNAAASVFGYITKLTTPNNAHTDTETETQSNICNTLKDTQNFTPKMTIVDELYVKQDVTQATLPQISVESTVGSVSLSSTDETTFDTCIHPTFLPAFNQSLQKRAVSVATNRSLSPVKQRLDNTVTNEVSVLHRHIDMTRENVEEQKNMFSDQIPLTRAEKNTNSFNSDQHKSMVETVSPVYTDTNIVDANLSHRESVDEALHEEICISSYEKVPTTNEAALSETNSSSLVNQIRDENDVKSAFSFSMNEMSNKKTTSKLSSVNQQLPNECLSQSLSAAVSSSKMMMEMGEDEQISHTKLHRETPHSSSTHSMSLPLSSLRQRFNKLRHDNSVEDMQALLDRDHGDDDLNQSNEDKENTLVVPKPSFVLSPNIAEDEASKCSDTKPLQNRNVDEKVTQSKSSQAELEVQQNETLALKEERDLILADHSDLVQRHEALWKDFHELKKTLEDVMMEYENCIEKTEQLKREHGAKDELHELEITRLRSTLKENNAHMHEIKTVNASMCSELSTLKQVERDLRSDIDRIGKKLYESEQLFNCLKKQAEEKLCEAKDRYTNTCMEMQQTSLRLSDMKQQIKSLQDENKGIRGKLQTKQIQSTELTERIQSLVCSLREKEGNSERNARHLQAAQKQLDQELDKVQDLQARSDRYKNGLALANEDIRALQDRMVHMTKIEQQNETLTRVRSALSGENDKLKSRIFDAMEDKQHLERRLQAAGVATTDQDEGKQDAMVLELQEQLNVKARENGELVAISEELLRQLEQYRSTNLPSQ